MKSTNPSQESYIAPKPALSPPTLMNKIFHNHNWGSETDSTGLGSRPEPCGYCGSIHNGFCSRIKKMEYFENGTIRSIEFHDNKFAIYRDNGGYSGYCGLSGFGGSW